jgi:hypothetical protein
VTLDNGLSATTDWTGLDETLEYAGQAGLGTGTGETLVVADYLPCEGLEKGQDWQGARL